MKLNIRNAAATLLVDPFDELDLADTFDRKVVEEAEMEFDSADSWHHQCHEWWAYNTEPDWDDELWMERESSIKYLNEARENLIEAYKFAGIDPRKEWRTEYAYISDGTRIRRGYVVTRDDEYVYTYSSYETALDAIYEMADELADEPIVNGYVRKTTFEVVEKTDAETPKWDSTTATMRVTRHITLFDGHGWCPGTHEVLETTIKVVPQYTRY